MHVGNKNDDEGPPYHQHHIGLGTRCYTLRAASIMVIPCHFASSFYVRRLLQRCCSSSAEIETLLDCLFLVSHNFINTSVNLLFFDTYDSIFFWEILSQWMFPLLTGFSVFCLANHRLADFTRIFGGSSSGGNEGFGFLTICLDWQYISGSMSL